MVVTLEYIVCEPRIIVYPYINKVYEPCTCSNISPKYGVYIGLQSKSGSLYGANCGICIQEGHDYMCGGQTVLIAVYMSYLVVFSVHLFSIARYVCHHEQNVSDGHQLGIPIFRNHSNMWKRYSFSSIHGQSNIKISISPWVLNLMRMKLDYIAVMKFNYVEV